MPTDTLVEALWGSELPAAPRNAVQHRDTAPPGTWGRHDPTRRGRVRARERTVDASEFEELLTARTALRAGDARGAAEDIADALPLARPCIAWSSSVDMGEREAGRLDALRLDALEERFEAALALGEHADLIRPYALRSTRARSASALWGQLMLALYRSGRQADALDVFQEARRVLMDELALEPGPELRRFKRRSWRTTRRSRLSPLHQGRARQLPAPSTSFIDREAELGQVVEPCGNTAS